MKNNRTSKTRNRIARMRRQAAFTLVEIMVVMAMLSFIVLGLMAMFDQTQKAFRAGMAQVDQLEGGRMFNDLIVRDLQQMKPSYETNGVNFLAEIPAGYSPLLLPLIGSTSVLRTNVVHDIYFTTRENQYWNGIGYLVRTNPSYLGFPNQVGSLYRYEASTHTMDYIGNAYQPYLNFRTSTSNFSKLLDGVVEFRIQCFDNNGRMITNGSPSIATNNFVDITNSFDIAPGQVDFYGFSNNIVPAYVDIELGVLEPAVLKRYRAIQNPTIQSNYLASHSANVQVFRQRVAIRNADPSAYSPQP